MARVKLEVDCGNQSGTVNIINPFGNNINEREVMGVVTIELGESDNYNGESLKIEFNPFVEQGGVKVVSATPPANYDVSCGQSANIEWSSIDATNIFLYRAFFDVC